MNNNQRILCIEADGPTPAARPDAGRVMVDNPSTAGKTEGAEGRREVDRFAAGQESSALKRSRLRWSLSVCLLCTFLGCYGKPADTKNASRGSNPPPSIEAKTIVDRYRGLDTSKNSAAKVKVVVRESDGSNREFRLTMNRKREADGSQFLLIEFSAPPEERDRSSLITISPQGEIEATRYAQSTESFVSARGVTSEDSLFGMSLQELAEGQPEKYDFTVVGEENFNSTPVYRLDGKLKEGEESKFPRVVLLIAKDTFAALVAEFYDKSTLVRRITVDKVEQIEGIPTRMHWTIDNIGRQKKIDFEALSVAYNQKLSDSLFTREHLKKISSK